jgi:hypothetical protein
MKNVSRKIPLILILFAFIMSVWSPSLSNVKAHSGDIIDARFGTTPTVDGILSDGEWDDANFISYRKRINTVSIYFKENGENFYVGFDIPDSTKFDFDDSGINIDLNDNGDVDPEDCFIEISREGNMRERHEEEPQDGPDDYRDYVDPVGWHGNFSSNDLGWQVEYNISFSKLNMTPGIARTFGIAFHTLDSSNGEFDWPTDCHIRDASTFADIISSDNWGENIGPTNIFPVASFTFSPESPTIEDTIQFSDTSLDRDGSIVSWYWDFGDGSDSNQQNTTHQYTTANEYSVSLTVTDDDQSMDNTTIIITVYEKPTNVVDIPDNGDPIDEQPKEKDEDKEEEKGWVPGFESLFVILGIMLIILFFKYRPRG